MCPFLLSNRIFLGMADEDVAVDVYEDVVVGLVIDEAIDPGEPFDVVAVDDVRFEQRGKMTMLRLFG